MKESWFAQHIHGDRELTFLFCGRQDSSPGELAGPAGREHYVLYFCLEGRGEYQFRDTHCAIGPGEGFLVPPGEVVSIRADQKEPWKLIWVGFTGCRAAEYLGRCGLGKENRAFRCDVPEQLERCVQEMVRCEMLGRGHEFLLLGELYRFLGWIARSAEEPDRLSVLVICEMLVHAISLLYKKWRPFSADCPEWMQALLQKIHSPEYISCSAADVYRLAGYSPPVVIQYFRQYTGDTVTAYLTKAKMDFACSLLLTTQMTTIEIACQLGYSSLSHFNKCFRNHTGKSPREYRRAAGSQGR